MEVKIKLVNTGKDLFVARYLALLLSAVYYSNLKKKIFVRYELWKASSYLSIYIPPSFQQDYSNGKPLVNWKGLEIRKCFIVSDTKLAV